MTRTCSECGAVAECDEHTGLVWRTVCGHVLCFSCAEKPALYNVNHTCLCGTGYGPATSLHKITEDRRLERVKELAA